jgi:hypothetical protein
MSHNVRTLFIAMGIVSFLFLALIAGVQFSKATAPPRVPVADVPPAAINQKGAGPPVAESDRDPAALHSSAEVWLKVARTALESAQSDLAKATTNNKGGYVERARTDISNALDLLNQGIDFASLHPEIDKTPPAPAPPLTADLKAARGGGGAGQAPNLRSALSSVKTAFDELQQSPGDDFGGTRVKLNSELQNAATDLVAGINYAGTATVTRNGRKGGGGVAGL